MSSTQIQIPVKSADTQFREYNSLKNLGLFNLIMGFVHLIQGIAILFLGNDYKVPVTSSFLQLDPINKIPSQAIEEITKVHLAPVVASFLFISAIAHFILCFPGVFDWYIYNLKRKVNFVRWFEYAISSSVMIVVISLLCGILDFATLILIFVVNASMNLFGLLMEQTNSQIRDLNPSAKVSWTAYIFGCFIGIVPWIILGIYFFSTLSNSGEIVKVPDFVYGIFYSLFFFFNIFALNMFLQYMKIGPWKNYIFGEKVYILLSLVAKSLLAWQVFGGTLR